MDNEPKGPPAFAPDFAEKAGPRPGRKAAIAGGIVLAVGGVCGALLTTGVFGGPGRTEAPHPSASMSPSATPQPTIDADGYTLPGLVSVDPSLPDALPLPDGIWDQTGPGWILADYMPIVLGPDDPADPSFMRPVIDRGKHVLYLIDPEGTRYQVAELDPDIGISLESWSAGESVAYVRKCDQPGDCDLRQPGASGWKLDLTDGKVSPPDFPWSPDDLYVAETPPGGARLWLLADVAMTGPSYLDTTGPAGSIFTPLGDRWEASSFPLWQSSSPDGLTVVLMTDNYLMNTVPGSGSEMLVVNVMEKTTSTVTFPLGSDWQCNGSKWIDATHAQVLCSSSDEGLETTYILDTADLTSVVGETREADFSGSPSRGQVDPFVRRELQVAPDVWVGYYDDGSPYSEGDPAPATWINPPIAIDRDGVISIVLLVLSDSSTATFSSIEGHVGSTVYLTIRSDDWTATPTLVSYEVETGQQTILLPSPTSGPTVGATASNHEVEMRALLSWVVAP